MCTIKTSNTILSEKSIFLFRKSHDDTWDPSGNNPAIRASIFHVTWPDTFRTALVDLTQWLLSWFFPSLLSLPLHSWLVEGLTFSHQDFRVSHWSTLADVVWEFNLVSLWFSRTERGEGDSVTGAYCYWKCDPLLLNCSQCVCRSKPYDIGEQSERQWVNTDDRSVCATHSLGTHKGA